MQENHANTVSETIAALLVPGVTAAMRDAYIGLPDKAAHTDFGPLEEGVMFLDT